MALPVTVVLRGQSFTLNLTQDQYKGLAAFIAEAAPTDLTIVSAPEAWPAQPPPTQPITITTPTATYHDWSCETLQGFLTGAQWLNVNWQDYVTSLTQEGAPLKINAPKPPRVVRIRRKGGVSVVPFDMYIGRRFTMGGWDLPESKWFNPYKVDRDGTREQCLAKYEAYVRSRPDLLAALPELAGLTLGCWCHPQGCHGDVLAKLFVEVVLGQADPK